MTTFFCVHFHTDIPVFVPPLQVYDCGKSATRVIPGTAAQSVHHWKLPDKFQEKRKTGLADPRNLDVSKLLLADWPCVLHYVTCGLEWFKDKYVTHASLASSFGCFPSCHICEYLCFIYKLSDPCVRHQAVVYMRHR